MIYESRNSGCFGVVIVLMFLALVLLGLTEVLFDFVDVRDMLT